MLWTFRRELILLLFLFAGFRLISHGVHFPRLHFQRISTVQNTPAPETLLRDNENLRGLLDLKQKRIFSRIVFADVTGVSPWVFPSVISLDKGANDGVRKDMSIVSGKGCLIGRITDVEPDSSRGVTLFHPSNQVSVTVSSTGEFAILQGGAFPYLRIKFLPPDCRATAGDMVRTSNVTQIFPRGITVGKLMEIIPSSKEFIMEGSVRPSFYYDSFNQVAVVE